jgi:hypothetical protein
VSLQRSNLVSSVRLLAGDLPDEPLPDGLPSNLIFETLCDLETEMLRDVDLSNQNRRVNPTPMEITLTANSTEPFSVSVGDFHAPAFAQLKTDSSSDFWYPVEIENHTSLLQAGLDGRLAVAFTGTPPKGFVSWIPDSTHTLRVYYERTPSNPTMSGSTELGSLYDSYLKLQCAAQVREFLKMEVGEILKARLIKSEQQWKKYVGMSRQQGKSNKPMCFTPPRYRRRYVGDRTRFFIP